MPSHGQGQLIEMAIKSVVNALWDAYNATDKEVTWEQYWKSHINLTEFQTIDNYVQKQVSAAVKDGYDTAADAARYVRGLIGV